MTEIGNAKSGYPSGIPSAFCQFSLFISFAFILHLPPKKLRCKNPRDEMDGKSWPLRILTFLRFHSFQALIGFSQSKSEEMIIRQSNKAKFC